MILYSCTSSNKIGCLALYKTFFFLTRCLAHSSCSWPTQWTMMAKLWPSYARSRPIARAKLKPSQLFERDGIYGIQLQQSLRYPNLSGSSLSRRHSSSSRAPNHWLQAVLHKEHSLVALDGDLCSGFPDYSTNKCSWNRHNSSVKLLCCMTYIMRLFLLTSTHRIKMRVLERNASDGVNPII